MEPIRNERHEIVGYRQELPGGRVDVRNKSGELVGWTAGCRPLTYSANGV